MKKILDYRIDDFNDGSPITKLWRFTRWLSKESPAIKWNKILVALGYSGFVDYGEGYIHMNEPTQAFFVSTKYFDVVDKIDNRAVEPSSTYHRIMKTVPDGVKQVLKKMKKASTDRERARIVKDSNYSYKMYTYNIPFSDNLKKEFLKIHVPVKNISFDGFKDVFHEKDTHDVLTNILYPTLEQLQYVVDNTIDLNTATFWYNHLDKLKFSEKHYNSIINSELPYFEIIKIVGDAAFKNKEYANRLSYKAARAGETALRHFVSSIDVNDIDFWTIKDIINTSWEVNLPPKHIEKLMEIIKKTDMTDTEKKYYEIEIKGLANNDK